MNGRRGGRILPSSAALLDGFQAGRSYPLELPNASSVFQARRLPLKSKAAEEGGSPESL
jgi:hypothetical protein